VAFAFFTENAQAIGAIAALVFGPGGAAWIGVKVALNGTREKVREIHDTLEDVRDDVTTLKVDVARLKERSELD
jgi:hypothetical protein